MLSAVIKRVANGENLSLDEMSEVIGTIMDGQCSDDEIGQLLLGLREKGETTDEVAGAVEWLMESPWITGQVIALDGGLSSVRLF